jgi:phosphopantothenoylcysteine decarboxylase/phosphopantothenate--cysteine ligase
MMLKGKRVLIGISGGIAAYKIPFLVRYLVKNGAEVRCILTPSASAFVTPLTLATLSKNEVASKLYDAETGIWTNHVELGLWADLFIIAPLTASSLAKMAQGQSDNLMLTTYLSARCPVLVAPAMDLDMYAHPSTTRNLATLKADGVHVLNADSGELASGLSGQGRMTEPEDMLQAAINLLCPIEQKLKNQKVLVTAGPTYEAIDPVRFIGNHSSGKMGIAIAHSFAQQGADVTLVLGPSSQKVDNSERIKIVRVNSAEEMLVAVQNEWHSQQIGVFSAAVADYRPKTQTTEKIKKNDDEMRIDLVKNPDILAWAGANKSSLQFLVGFALETNNALANAQSKLERKNLDLIVLNSLENEGAGFAFNTNKVTFVAANNKITNFELLLKTQVAENIVHYVIENKK